MDPGLQRILDDLDRDRFQANMDAHFDTYMRERAGEDRSWSEATLRTIRDWSKPQPPRANTGPRLHYIRFRDGSVDMIPMDAFDRYFDELGDQ